MKATIKLLAGIVTALALLGTSYSAVAEKRDMTYTKSVMRTVSKNAITLTESPNHKVSQEVQFHAAKFSSPDFQPIEEWVYIHFDQTDGSGIHKGYYTLVFKGGDQAYGTFEGTHKTASKDDGSWLSTWDGTYKYLGGSGKYKNIKGTGAYKGKIGSKESFFEEGREQVEY